MPRLGEETSAAAVSNPGTFPAPDEAAPVNGPAECLHCSGEAVTEQPKSPADDLPAPNLAPSSKPAAGSGSISFAQMLDTFRNNSRPWTLRLADRVLTGRTWGSGPPLYFLNGFIGSHELYAPLAWLLRKSFRCVVFDDNAGDKRQFSRGSTLLTAFTDGLFAVADDHGDAEFPVFGSSFGSLVALNAMSSQPQRIEHAILLHAFAQRQLSMFERALTLLGGLTPGRFDRIPLHDRLLALNHRHWFPQFDRARWQFFLADTGQTPLSVLARKAAVIRDCDRRAALASIGQPVLLIGSEGGGAIASACQQDCEARLPNARTEYLDNCGFLPHLTQSHRLATLVRSFLQGAAPRETARAAPRETKSAC